jgi:hypothetical protein
MQAMHEKRMFLMKASIVCTLVAAAFLFVGNAPRASATCTNPNSILHATYGWQSQALLAAGKSPNPKIGDFIPSVQVGHLTFDGNGNFSGAHDTAAGGATTGGVSSGTLRLMADAPCSAGILNGNSYGYASHGLVAAGNGNGFPRVGGFVPFANAGQIFFRADGSVSGVDNLNFGGVVMPGQHVAGTYIVNADCTGTTTMTIAGVDNSWHFVLLQGGDQVIFVATPSGVVWAGTLTKD